MNSVIYLVRHGEVEHHRSDVRLTTTGREQAKAKGEASGGCIDDDSIVNIHYSPVFRVRETAEVLHESLSTSLENSKRKGSVCLHVPAPDTAICNPRFTVDSETPPEEPSRLYRKTTDPAFLNNLPLQQAAFYRGFWADPDPMGYWLTHDSGGGAETPGAVLDRLLSRLKSIFTANETQPAKTYWIMVTHSGTMRVLLQEAQGLDPGEPEFCEEILIRAAAKPNWIDLTFRDQTASMML